MATANSSRAERIDEMVEAIKRIRLDEQLNIMQRIGVNIGYVAVPASAPNDTRIAQPEPPAPSAPLNGKTAKSEDDMRLCCLREAVQVARNGDDKDIGSIMKNAKTIFEFVTGSVTTDDRKQPEPGPAQPAQLEPAALPG